MSALTCFCSPREREHRASGIDLLHTMRRSNDPVLFLWAEDKVRLRKEAMPRALEFAEDQPFRLSAYEIHHMGVTENKRIYKARCP